MRYISTASQSYRALCSSDVATQLVVLIVHAWACKVHREDPIEQRSVSLNSSNNHSSLEKNFSMGVNTKLYTLTQYISKYQK